MSGVFSLELLPAKDGECLWIEYGDPANPHRVLIDAGRAGTHKDVLRRIETMVLMAGVELPIKAIREQIASAFDLIVYQARFRDGTRKITYITEVQGMEGDVIVLQDLFVFQQTGQDQDGLLEGRFVSNGMRPRFLAKMEANGAAVNTSFFQGF